MFSRGTVIALVALLPLALAQDYIYTCDTASFTYAKDGERALLKGVCFDGPGGNKFNTEMDINLCVANDNGTLNGRTGGNFSNSCDCTLDGSSKSVLNCWCQGGPNGPQWSTYDLNTIMANRHGNLQCLEHMGKVEPVEAASRRVKREMKWQA